MALKNRSKKEKEEIVLEMRKRVKKAIEFEREQRELALEDVRFIYDDDAQWTEQAKAARDGRPCMTFDKVGGAVNQIIGDHLQNRPGIKVRAAEDGDAKIADIYTGLIRAIESTSNAKRAYKTGFKFSVAGGIGHWRVRTQYADDDTFDQDIILDEIPNPFTCYGDPMAKKVTKEDGRFWVIYEDWDLEEFEERFPKAKTTPADAGGAAGMEIEWFSEDGIRVAEYLRKVPEKYTILKLSDGRTVRRDEVESILDEMEVAGITVDMEREVEGLKIEHFLCSGAEVLEEYEHPGKYFGIVPLYGKVINIEGAIKYRGVVRPAKDAQRSYNYERSNFIEHTALQPKQPYLATDSMIEGHEDQWKNLNVRNDPVLLFNFDQGQRPSREMPGQPNQAYMAALALSSDDIKATTNIYDASLGARSNETSGRAIVERDRQGDTATFEFTDEFMEALEYTGKVLIDLIPRIYDGARTIKILGEDEMEEDVQINQSVRDDETGATKVINDLTVGKYDLVVRTGASYATKRSETANQMAQVMAQNPEIGKLVADVYFKSLDLVGGEEIVERIRKMGIQQGWIEPNEEEKEKMKPTPEQEQMKKFAQQLQMRDKKADVEKKEAEVKSENAKAQEQFASAKLKAAQAAMEALELQIAQGNAMSQRVALEGLRNVLSLQPQTMMQGVA